MWKRRLRRISRLARRPFGDQLLIVQTVVLLGVTRLLINLLTFPRLERFLGERLLESPAELSDADEQAAARVGWAVRGVSDHTPWNSNCFPQALTAKVLLRRRNISSTLYLGAKFADDRRELRAHAWLRSGRVYVTGGDGSEKYGAIATFA